MEIKLSGRRLFLIFFLSLHEDDGLSSTAVSSADGGQKLKQLLSFAIGGLLGDVFLHLLPEAWAISNQSGRLCLSY